MLETIISVFAAAALLAAASPKYGPPSAPLATPLSRSNDYFRQPGNGAPDFWALMPYYAAQASPYSCSCAAVAMVVNGFYRAGKTLEDDVKNITEADLLRKVKAAHWARRLSEPGYAGGGPAHGLTLTMVGETLQESLRSFGKDEFAIQAVEVSSVSPAALAAFRQALAANEAAAEDFLLAHFVQDGLTAAPGGPYAHVSPLGAYDRAGQRVLVMDVDRDWYEPYWVGDEALLKAMAVKTDAFGFGGYVHVRRLKSR